jgi:hypothetical protein
MPAGFHLLIAAQFVSAHCLARLTDSAHAPGMALLVAG